MTILYAQAGALEDASRDLEALAVLNPGSSIVDQLEASLETITRGQKP